ncbi:MAG: dipeptide epimerase [Deltaproteobacteria bacterium]|nr:MAG: dipeptide epimerase [Deltaproteobacteria bacterium]
MKIKKITISTVTIPLNTTFKTALRSVSVMENVLVCVHTECGLTGLGGAAPTPVISGETTRSIQGAVEHIAEYITGMDVLATEQLLTRLNQCMVGNSAAKSAVDMAIYDILGKYRQTSVSGLLGGITGSIETDITISLNPVQQMAEEAERKAAEGFSILKIKVGGEPKQDLARLTAISRAAGDDVLLRLDANQGWSPKQAVWVGREIERQNLPVELMEQPVAAGDTAGLKFVRDHVAMPVYADESVFSPQDAMELLGRNAVDGINIKLPKCGGIYNAVKIAALAESAGVPCMVGSMMESAVSVSAAAHFAASRAVVQKYDLDAPLFCSFQPVPGGISYDGPAVHLPEGPGLGLEPDGKI